MKFLDLFAGIGGFRLGMESAGHECVGFCEIDKFARTSYKAIHDTTGEVEMHDITTITDEFIRGIGSVDVICGGFPCQAFSIAGKRRGFEDTRGTLFFEIARFASILRPRYLFLENVRGLLNHEGGATFETILRTLDELGYDVEWDLFNSKDYVPQNRERVFIIGHLRGTSTRKVFPFERESGSSDKERRINIVGSTKREHQTTLGQRELVYGSDGLIGALTATDYKQPKQIAIPVLTPDQSAETIDKVIGSTQKNATITDGSHVPTLTGAMGTGGGHIPMLVSKLTANYQIRKLTPRECWRLQSFPDWAFDKAKYMSKEESEIILKKYPNHKGKRKLTHEERIERMSNSQLYKQAGNSVTVAVIADIAKRL